MMSTNEFRKNIANEFIMALQEDGLDWKKNWCDTETPMNANGTQYRGINKLHLSLISMVKGWKDPRFYTFKQIEKHSEDGWKLQKGSKGTYVEYWFPYDTQEKKMITWADYKKLSKGLSDEEMAERFVLRARYYTVFNASMIENIPEYLPDRNEDVEEDEIIRKISDGLGVPIINEGDDAFYSPKEDCIKVPCKEYFKDSESYNAVVLHELGHSTGHKSRLNRNILNMFGTPEYAKEELVAEITSAMMSQFLGVEISSSALDNHKAYVQSWISAIQEKPETLMKAIGDAEKAADYMIEKGGLEKVMEDDLER